MQEVGFGLSGNERRSGKFITSDAAVISRLILFILGCTFTARTLGSSPSRLTKSMTYETSPVQ